MLVGLEAGALGDLGFDRVAQVLAVQGLDFGPPSAAARSRKRGLWMAARRCRTGRGHGANVCTHWPGPKATPWSTMPSAAD